MGVKWKVLFHRYAVKDLELLKRAGLSAKAKALAELLENDPFQTPPPYEKLSGDLKGCIPGASTSSTGWYTRSTRKTEPCACCACGHITATTDKNIKRPPASRVGDRMLTKSTD